MLKPGTYLQDRYEILSLIGTGGMSEVYQAKCHTLNRLVAIKVLKEEFSQDANFVSKFKMEAQAAAGLSHPNIVSVYDVVDESDLHYIVMELIEGITLKSYIVKKGHLGVKETIGIAIQVAQGIAAAHDQHIVHRDIKPQNMIISRDGKVKVADFGIAKAVSAQTVGSNAVGSVHYISPEQARGGSSDHRSDIYAMGVTMYEMLTGKVPFDGENAVTIALSHLEEPIMPPSHLNSEVPASLDRIILKCTKKKPERRYQSAYELVADLRHALVDPDDSYLKKKPEFDESSPTLPRDRGELEQIRERQKKAESEEQEKSSVSSVPEEKEDPREPEREERTETKDRKDEDVNPQMERLLTIIGVAAAVVIVAVVIGIFAKLGGLFNSGSGTLGSESGEVVEETVLESLADTQTRVPQLLDMTEEEAKSALEQASLTVHCEYAESEDEKEGLVIGQSIAYDTVVAKQSEVVITVGEGSGSVDLSALELANRTAGEAQKLLESEQISAAILEEVSNDTEKGLVIRVEPERADPGDTVTLVVSSGPDVPTVPMPEITGLSEENAQIVLEAVGLALGERKEEASSEVAKGLILSQEVEAKTDTPQGTEVGYTVSTGKGTRFVASVNDEYSLRSLFGPSTGDARIKVSIVMVQEVDGQTVEKVIMEPRDMGGDITIPVHYNIEGADGVLTGRLEIRDLTNSRVIHSYALEFVEVDR